MVALGGFAAMAIAILTVFWTSDMPLEPRLPQPVQTPPDRVSLVAFGTSLTARYDWPEALAHRLGSCLGRPVDMTVVAGPGETSRWAETVLSEVVAAAPDLVLIEFEVNDSDLRRGISVEEARRLQRGIAGKILTALPETRLVYLAMNPAYGLRSLLRPRRAAYRSGYAILAESDPRIGMLDLVPAWRKALTKTDRRTALPDGLHPHPEIARQVIVPTLAPELAAIFGARCPADLTF